MASIAYSQTSIKNTDTAARLVHHGYVVHGIDHEGHDKSSGSKGYLSSFGDVVRDCSDHFKSVCGENEAVDSSSYICTQTIARHGISSFF
jgi:alpha-beta hydrolase superfamily lysophospholipase